MTFEETIRLLFGNGGNKKSGLEQVKRTALNMGLFPLGFKTVQIAGTNGKGTAACALGAILTEAGLKTGLFTSPHLKTPLERIKINDVLISKADFAKAVSYVAEKQAGALNFFEILTLAALFYFKAEKVDAAIIECGIGGLLDSTNIINADLCLITSISLDHCDMLGRAIEDIALQKSGIIKNGASVVVGPLGGAALTIVKKACEKAKAKLIKTGKIKNLKQNFKRGESSFEFNGGIFRTKLLGSAQNGNSAIALRAALALGVDEKVCEAALSGFAMPCRFEVKKIKRGKYLIKDGAHNPAAFKEFIKTYKNSPFRKKNNTLLFACSKGHDYKKLCSLAERNFDNIILVCPDQKRNIKAQDLVNCFNKKTKVSVLRDISLLDIKALKGNIIAAGSFYLTALL